MSEGNLTPILLIGGPTGVGKSGLAVRCAQAFNGEVVNIDSVQVYRGLDIGSAKIPEVERCGIPHHLLDCALPDHQSNVAEFIARATNAIADIQGRGKQAIVAGGTGLYCTALFHGLAQLPRADMELRQQLDLLTDSDLFAQLERVDPLSARRLHVNDRIRVARALESYLISGTPASALRDRHRNTPITHLGLCVVLLEDRASLYARLEKRVDAMIAGGLEAEVRALIETYGADAPALDSIGYREMVEGIREGASIDEAREKIARATRQFAKRQLTFWRNEPLKRGWETSPRDDERGEGTITIDADIPKVRPARCYQWSAPTLIDKIANRLKEPFSRPVVWYVHGPTLVASGRSTV